MKASKLVTAAAALALVTGVASKASARTPRDNSDDDRYAYVMVTGSNIPQKVRIKAIGTKTESPVRVFDRHEIDQTGAFNTEDVLRHDPSIQVHGFGQAGPGN
jgi:outer membrane cobalamin receptor